MKTTFARLFSFLLIAFFVFRAMAEPAERINVRLQFARPVLEWSNRPGDAYVVESRPNLFAGGWERRVVLTTDAASAVWADDRELQRATFYRVSLTYAQPFQELQETLERACIANHIIGASAASVLPGTGLWVGNYGTSDGSAPIRPHTPFELGSITKMFMAAVVLKLAEEKRLTLDDTIGQWLPDLTVTNVSPAITIRQLLNHRSGVYNFGDDRPFQQALFANLNRYWAPEEVFEYVRAPDFAPGEGGYYSNTGYLLLGMIIRRVTGSSVDLQLERTILEPLELRSTVLGARTNWTGALARPHFDWDRDGTVEEYGEESQTAILTSFWTSGAMVSTPADAVRFSSGLFDGRLLNTETLAAMQKFAPVARGEGFFDYGLGLIRWNILGREYWGHSGGLFGEYSWLLYSPGARFSLAVSFNYPQPAPIRPGLPDALLSVLSNLTPVAGFSVK